MGQDPTSNTMEELLSRELSVLKVGLLTLSVLKVGLITLSC